MAIVVGKLSNSESIKEVIQYVPFDLKIIADYSLWNKIEANITDVIFVMKKNKSDSNDTFLTKKKSVSGISIDDITKTFTVSVTQEDFSSLNTEIYLIRLGILFDGETQYRDIGEIQNGSITIKESWIDYIHQQ